MDIFLDSTTSAVSVAVLLPRTRLAGEPNNLGQPRSLHKCAKLFTTSEGQSCDVRVSSPAERPRRVPGEVRNSPNL